MKKKILIISGGFSKEREISLQTGNQVAKELKKNGYIVKICEPNHNLYDLAKSFKPDIIFNALHILTPEYLHLQKQWIKKFQKKYLLKIKY